MISWRLFPESRVGKGVGYPVPHHEMPVQQRGKREGNNEEVLSYYRYGNDASEEEKSAGFVEVDIQKDEFRGQTHRRSLPPIGPQCRRKDRARTTLWRPQRRTPDAEAEHHPSPSM